MTLFKRPRIGFPLTPLDIKGINDFFQTIMYKVSGNINFADMSPAVNKTIANVIKVSEDYESNIEQTAQMIALKVSKDELGTEMVINFDSIRIGFNSITNVIEMTIDGLKVNHTDGSYTKLMATGLQKHIGTTDKDYHFLTATGSAVSGGTPAVYWVQLADEFKGKNFIVALGIKSTVDNGYQLTDWVSDIRLYVDSYNYTQGSFGVVAYWNASNGSEVDDKPLEFTYIVTA